MRLTTLFPPRGGLVFLASLTLLGTVWTLADQAPTSAIGVAAAGLLAWGLLGSAEGTAHRLPKPRAGIERDTAGNPKRFTLQCDGETITLDPGRAWHQLDHFKWVTRGILDEPPGLHVHPDGSVEVGGERIGLDDATGPARLEQEFGKRHQPDSLHRPATPPVPGTTPPAHPADRVEFKVRLDHLGHLMIDCFRGPERVETSLRGLTGLIQNGLMRQPDELHLDPLQHYVEIDGVRFETTETGARDLQALLNARFAPPLKATGHHGVKITENQAAATGFDIHFMTHRAGVRSTIKGHLSQANLDLLQDQSRCDLLRPGMILKLSPPFLFVRRRRPDGGEERVAELPDVQYRRITAGQLQDLLNHPLLRRPNAGTEAGAATAETRADIVAIHGGRNPQTKAFLWMTCVTNDGKEPTGKALTHHNIADLQHASAFQAHLDVNLSLDNRTLSVLNTETRAEQTLVVDYQSSDEDIRRLSGLLTNALRPPQPAKTIAAIPALTDSTTVEDQAAAATRLPAPPASAPVEPATGNGWPPITPSSIDRGSPGEESPAESPPETREVIAATPARLPRPEPERAPPPAAPPPLADEVPDARLDGFGTHPPTEIIDACFRQVAARFGLAIQEVRLSLTHVFAQRRFEIIALDGQPVMDLFELRSDAFYGFYLSHVHEDAPDLVYACGGTHIEFGATRCLIQTSLATEPQEFRGDGLRGLAQNHAGHFVFIVTPGYRAWAKPVERACAEAYAHFVTVAERAPTPQEYPLLWPPPST